MNMMTPAVPAVAAAPAGAAMATVGVGRGNIAMIV